MGALVLMLPQPLTKLWNVTCFYFQSSPISKVNEAKWKDLILEVKELLYRQFLCDIILHWICYVNIPIMMCVCGWKQTSLALMYTRIQRFCHLQKFSRCNNYFIWGICVFRFVEILYSHVVMSVCLHWILVCRSVCLFTFPNHMWFCLSVCLYGVLARNVGKSITVILSSLTTIY